MGRRAFVLWLDEGTTCMQRVLCHTEHIHYPFLPLATPDKTLALRQWLRRPCQSFLIVAEAILTSLVDFLILIPHQVGSAC